MQDVFHRLSCGCVVIPLEHNDDDRSYQVIKLYSCEDGETRFVLQDVPARKLQRPLTIDEIRQLTDKINSQIGMGQLTEQAIGITETISSIRDKASQDLTFPESADGP